MCSTGGQHKGWSPFLAAGRDGKPAAPPGAGAGFSTLESGPTPALRSGRSPCGETEEMRARVRLGEGRMSKRGFDSSWALWLSVLGALAEGSLGCEGLVVMEAPGEVDGAQRIVLLCPVTGLCYRARTNSERSKENHLFLKQGSSPALPSSRVPWANSALPQGCELAE